jgi:ubiquinone/menaquinone biosynthesis C-methylase UbiE
MATQPIPELEALKARQQQAWSAGDYAVIGTGILLMAELLMEALDVRAGWNVLDVAAGNGNASLAAARRGCRVTSTDYVPALLDRGRARASAEGLRIDFQIADAENLPFDADRFDAVFSTVGVMFAPNQPRAAAELFRVTKPGGLIGLANWTPAGFVGQIFKILGKYLPPPAGAKPPSLWGTEAHLHEIFPQAEEIKITPKSFQFRSLSSAHWLETFRTYYGPMNKAFAALDEAKGEALSADLIALCDSLNRSGDSTLIMPSDYIEVVIRKPLI